MSSSCTALIPYNPPKTPMEFITWKMEKKNPSRLENEQIVRIFLFLDVRDLAKSSQVSQRWKLLSNIGLQSTSDYTIAGLFQKLAEQYCADVENEAMCYVIKSRVTNPNFLQHSDALIQLSQKLIAEDREFGLQALMAIAKKFADLQMFGKAMETTELARTLGHLRQCPRAPYHNSETVYPFAEMGAHMLSLKQYKLAEECADKLNLPYRLDAEVQWGLPDLASPMLQGNLYADIVVKQINEENLVNETLFSKIECDTCPWVKAIEGLALGLIKHNRCREATEFAKSRLRTTWEFGKAHFKATLDAEGLSVPT